jgi:predicted kinase
MGKTFLLLIDGMTGSGKTEVSKLLSEKTPRVAVIGMDKVKRFVSDFKRGERDNTIARDIVFEMAKKYLDYGISVIIEQTFRPKDKELKKYEDLARDYLVPIHKVQLFTDSEIALKRVLDRQKDWEIKVPENRIKRNISFFSSKENDGFFVIDTSDISIRETKEKILGIMNESQ